MEVQYFKCNGCKCRRAENEFEVYKGIRRITCLTCKSNRIKALCIHKLQKYTCMDCGNGSQICVHKKYKSTCMDCGNGSQICEHRRRKSTCMDCGNGSQICEHKRRKHDCKECGDALKITIKTMLNCSKVSDQKYNRYDLTNFIDYSFIENLIEDSKNQCCYCHCELQFVLYQENLATIERINNDIGHNKGNCTIACRQCNFKRVKIVA